MTNTQSDPIVSVVMPVYNAEKFLREAIDSILRQTFEDFELIIINDGSTDKSQAIINYYAAIDSRIVAVEQPNHGVVYTANKAIEMARGKYIARMDADDVSLADRLLQEVNLLNSHPHTVLVCSSFEVFDDSGVFRYRDITPPYNRDLKRALYLRNPIANGSTMIRKQALIDAGLFEEIFAEDFHMWMKLAHLGDFEATSTVLYRWRMNPNGLTLSNNHLSMQYGKDYIEDRWRETAPRPASRHEIVEAIKQYKAHYAAGKASEFTNIILADLTQLAAKLVIHKRYIEGIRQLLAVASVNKAGLRAALQRIHFISRGHYSQLRKKVPFGRGSYDTAI
jgi:glycosyltransferase involved in cell wall biosynthesis